MEMNIGSVEIQCMPMFRRINAAEKRILGSYFMKKVAKLKMPSYGAASFGPV